MSITVVATIFVFGLLVLVHELGHFITAKSVGMRVDEFAIGFGPKIFSRRYGETVYSLRAIPLGGFNRIAGMDPDDEQDERSYNAKPVWARMIVILAGSFMNFVLPLLIFWGVFFSYGVSTPSNEPVIGEVISGKAADNAGLISGDKVIEINGEIINDWKHFVSAIQKNGTQVMDVDYERNGVRKKAKLIPEYDEQNNRILVGVISSVNLYQPGFIEAAGLAWQNTIGIIGRMLDGLVQMVTGAAAAEVSGPLGVAQMAGQVAKLGLVPLLQFAAFLSINLGIINLLPVPALDGGHFMTLLIEGVRGKPLGAKSAHYAQVVGFMLLMGLMLFATFKDLIRLNLFG